MGGPALALLATVAGCLLGAAPAAAAVPSGFIGITSDDVFAGTDDYRATNLSTQAAIGVQAIRQTFDWSTIEKAPGQYDLSYHDAYVAKAAAHGIRILPVLFKPPSFRGPSRGRATCPPRGNAAFATFAEALARRYGPGGSLWRERPDLPPKPIQAWQIWNEPNLPVYWCGRPSAKGYVAMLRSVGRAIERVDRRAHILTAGLPASRLSRSVPLERYVRSMYRAGARQAFDSLAINPYATNHRHMRSLLHSTRRLMNRHGDRQGTIWISELGWGDRGVKHRFIVGPQGQASRIRKSFNVIRRERRRLRLRGVVYYSWRDAEPYPPDFRNQWGLYTGLLRQGGAFKPAYYAFKNAVERLR